MTAELMTRKRTSTPASRDDPRWARVWHHLTHHLSRFVPKDAVVLELGAGQMFVLAEKPNL